MSIFVDNETTISKRADRSRGWCFTLNNYTEQQRQHILAIDSTYTIVGREVAATGTPHLQGYIYFKSAKSFSSIKKKLGCNSIHIEAAKGSPEQAAEYCMKDGDFEEKGIIPLSQKRKGDKEIARWNKARELAKEGKFDDIDGDIYMRCERTCKNLFNEENLKKQLADNSEMSNIWIFGPTGIGKSRSVRQDYPEDHIYIKPLNKWWDGYAGEPVVLIEDVDPSHEKWLGYFLKIWSDHYKFRGEIKGASLMLRPKTIIVTSQYAISKIFADPETVAALQRRFKTIHMGAEINCVCPACMQNRL